MKKRKRVKRKADMPGGNTAVTTAQSKGITIGAANTIEEAEKIHSEKVNDYNAINAFNYREKQERKKNLQEQAKLKDELSKQTRNQMNTEMAKAVKTGSLGEVMIQSSKSSSPWDNLHLIKVNSPKAGREVVDSSLTRPLSENYELNTSYVVAQNTVNNIGSKNSKSAGKPSGGGNLEAKGKIGKYGKSALGLGVMLAAGSAVTSLMMGSNKGRLNNSQMYGQQPYT